jgi:hypothetical protein
MGVSFFHASTPLIPVHFPSGISLHSGQQIALWRQTKIVPPFKLNYMSAKRRSQHAKGLHHAHRIAAADSDHLGLVVHMGSTDNYKDTKLCIKCNKQLQLSSDLKFEFT